MMTRSGSVSPSKIGRRVYGERLAGMGSEAYAIAAGSSLPRPDGVRRHRDPGSSDGVRRDRPQPQPASLPGVAWATRLRRAERGSSHQSPRPQLRDSRGFPSLAGKSGTLAGIERSASLRAISQSSSVPPVVIACCLDTHQADPSRHGSPYSEFRQDCPMRTTTTEDGTPRCCSSSVAATASSLTTAAVTADRPRPQPATRWTPTSTSPHSSRRSTCKTPPMSVTRPAAARSPAASLGRSLHESVRQPRRLVARLISDEAQPTRPPIYPVILA